GNDKREIAFQRLGVAAPLQSALRGASGEAAATALSKLLSTQDSSAVLLLNSHFTTVARTGDTASATALRQLESIGLSLTERKSAMSTALFRDSGGAYYWIATMVGGATAAVGIMPGLRRFTATDST